MEVAGYGSGEVDSGSDASTQTPNILARSRLIAVPKQFLLHLLPRELQALFQGLLDRVSGDEQVQHAGDYIHGASGCRVWFDKLECVKETESFAL